jgi:hypothetical protein
MGIGLIIAGVSAAVGVGSTVMQMEAQGDAKDAQQEQAAQQQAQNTANAAKQRRENVRRARVLAAQAEAVTGTQGTGESSGAVATQQNIQGNVSTGSQQVGQQMLNIQNNTAVQQSMLNAQTRAQTFANIGGLAQSIGGFALSMPSTQADLASGVNKIDKQLFG